MSQLTIKKLNTDEGTNIFPQIAQGQIAWLRTKVGDNKIMLSDGDKITEISENVDSISFPEISGNNTVWKAIKFDSGIQIFFNNSKQTIQLSDNNFSDRILSFDMSEDSVVWCTNHNWNLKLRDRKANSISNLDFIYGKIYFYNGKKTIVLNKDYKGAYPAVSENHVVWQGITSSDSDSDSDSEIFLYDGKKTIQLTSNDADDYFPQISGKNVIWLSGISSRNLFYYNGEETIQLNQKETSAFAPQLNGNRVVWIGLDSDGDREVFLYDGKQTIQITDNDLIESDPQVSGENIAWTSVNKANFFKGSQIFFYDGSKIIQLTDDDKSINIVPRIDGNRVVWQKLDVSYRTSDIMLATLNQGSASSIPPIDRIDRPTQTFNTYAIAIFGLVSIYLLKKLIGDR